MSRRTRLEAALLEAIDRMDCDVFCDRMAALLDSSGVSQETFSRYMKRGNEMSLFPEEDSPGAPVQDHWHEDEEVGLPMEQPKAEVPPPPTVEKKGKR